MNKPHYNELVLIKIEAHPTIPYAHGTFLAVVIPSHIDKNKYFELYYPLNVDTGEVEYRVANEEWSQLVQFISVDDLPDTAAYMWLRGINGFTVGMEPSDRDYYREEAFNDKELRLFSDEYLFSLATDTTEERRRMQSRIKTLSEFKELYYPAIARFPKEKELKSLIKE